MKRVAHHAKETVLLQRGLFLDRLLRSAGQPVHRREHLQIVRRHRCNHNNIIKRNELTPFKLVGRDLLNCAANSSIACGIAEFSY